MTVANLSDRERSIELTSYAEVVLADPRADAAHPVFSNLFVQTEFVPEISTLLCSRRPRSEGERRPWLWHSMVAQEGGEITYETDRARFVGRSRTPISPAAMTDSSPLSGTVGSVLDPIVSLRRTFKLAPRETIWVDFLLGVTESREAALALSKKYQNLEAIEHTFEFARSDVRRMACAAAEGDTELYERLAGALIYADPARRASLNVLLANRLGQSGLWKYGISGDLPIVLLQISDPSKMELWKQLFRRIPIGGPRPCRRTWLF